MKEQRNEGMKRKKNRTKEKLQCQTTEGGKERKDEEKPQTCFLSGGHFVSKIECLQNLNKKTLKINLIIKEKLMTFRRTA